MAEALLNYKFNTDKPREESIDSEPLKDKEKLIVKNISYQINIMITNNTMSNSTINITGPSSNQSGAFKDHTGSPKQVEVAFFSEEFVKTLVNIRDAIEKDGKSSEFLLRAKLLTIDDKPLIPGVEGAKTVDDLFQRIADQRLWSWFDIGLLDKLLVGDPFKKASRILNDYKKMLKDNVETRLKVAKEKEVKTEGRWIELKEERDHTNVTLKVLLNHKEHLIKHFGIPADVLTFSHAYKGCVTTCWYITSEVAAIAIKEKLLQNGGIERRMEKAEKQEKPTTTENISNSTSSNQSGNLSSRSPQSSVSSEIWGEIWHPLVDEYSDLCQTILKSYQKEGELSLDELITYCRYLLRCIKKSPAVIEAEEALKEVNTYVELGDVVMVMTKWLSFSFLERIIKRFPITSVKSSLEEYKAKLKPVLEEKLTNLKRIQKKHPEESSTKGGFLKLLVRYNWDADGITLKDVLESRQFLCSSLGIPDHLLQVVTVRPDSGIVEYLTLREFEKEISEKIQNAEMAALFLGVGIISLTVGERKYSTRKITNLDKFSVMEHLTSQLLTKLEHSVDWERLIYHLYMAQIDPLPTEYHYLTEKYKTSGQKMIPKQMSPEQMIPEQMSPEQMSPEQMSPEQMSPEQMSPEQMSPKQMSPEQMIPEQMIPEQMILEQMVPEQMILEQMIPDEPFSICHPYAEWFLLHKLPEVAREWSVDPWALLLVAVGEYGMISPDVLINLFPSHSNHIERLPDQVKQLRMMKRMMYGLTTENVAKELKMEGFTKETSEIESALSAISSAFIDGSAKLTAAAIKELSESGEKEFFHSLFQLLISTPSQKRIESFYTESISKVPSYYKEDLDRAFQSVKGGDEKSDTGKTLLAAATPVKEKLASLTSGGTESTGDTASSKLQEVKRRFQSQLLTAIMPHLPKIATVEALLRNLKAFKRADSPRLLSEKEIDMLHQESNLLDYCNWYECGFMRALVEGLKPSALAELTAFEEKRNTSLNFCSVAESFPSGPLADPTPPPGYGVLKVTIAGLPAMGELWTVKEAVTSALDLPPHSLLLRGYQSGSVVAVFFITQLVQPSEEVAAAIRERSYQEGVSLHKISIT